MSRIATGLQLIVSACVLYHYMHSSLGLIFCLITAQNYIPRLLKYLNIVLYRVVSMVAVILPQLVQ